MATLKITGVDDGTVSFVVERSKSLHFKGQAEYLRNLIREDMAKASAEKRNRLSQLLGPVHSHAEEIGLSEADLAEIVDRARNEVAKAKLFSEGASDK